MKTVKCRWREFGQIARRLVSDNSESARESGEVLEGLFFRGQSNAEWALNTTLERHSKYDLSVGEYSKAVVAMGKLIHSQAKDLPAIKDETPAQPSQKDLHFEGLPNIELAVYLRHHGFPSPLLDWSASPFVSAFFAYHNLPKDAKEVSVYVLERPRSTRGKVGFGLHQVGHFIAAGKRHSSQQSRYTWCSKIKASPFGEPICYFDTHLNQTGTTVSQIVLPASDAEEALRELKLMSINEFSMTGTTDALVRSALSELDGFGLKAT